MTISRRSALAGIAASLVAPAFAAGRGDIRLMAGTYANEGGAGLYPVSCPSAARALLVGVANPHIRNASFAVSSRAGRWYCVDEVDNTIGVYGPRWAPISRVESGGDSPCHLALDPKGRQLAVANYGSGTVGLYQLDQSGRPRQLQLLTHRGDGPDKDRQAGPHAHWVGFSQDGKWLHAVDLGADAIFATPVNPTTGRIGESAIAWQAPPGTGPRHMARHPRLPRAYVVSELSNMLFTLAADPDGRFRTIGSQSVRAAGATGAAFGAHIAIDAAARRLYVSVRGDNSLAVFSLDAHGMPILIQHIPSGGNWPRQFILLEPERRLLVANERSGDVTAFDMGQDGLLRATATSASVPGVVFLARA